MFLFFSDAYLTRFPGIFCQKNRVKIYEIEGIRYRATHCCSRMEDMPQYDDVFLVAYGKAVFVKTVY